MFQHRQVCDSRGDLFLRDVHPAGNSFYRLLDGPAVHHRGRTNTHDTDTRGTDVQRQVPRQRLDGTECGANPRRAFDVSACRTARQKNDDAGMLLEHPARRCVCRNELRLQNRRYGKHKFINGQIDNVFSISVLLCEGACRIENNVNAVCLVRDAIDVLIDSSRIQSVYHSRVRIAAIYPDLPRQFFYTGLRPAGKEDLGALSGKLPGDCGPNRHGNCSEGLAEVANRAR